LIKRRGLAALAATNAGVADFLRMVVTNELKRAQEHAVFIRMIAKDRFLTFLKNWLKRSDAFGTVHLPVQYEDIADHLGIKIETLSGLITELENSGTLSRTRSRRTLRLRKPLIAG
jgi:CRP-like cAMP-binding protein